VGGVETFINTVNDLAAVFGGEYDGGDFCSGLIFGRDGAKMLTDLALAVSDEKAEERRANKGKKMETKEDKLNKLKEEKKDKKKAKTTKEILK